MAINHRTVQRFLLTSKQFFFPEIAAKQAERCKSHLRTSVPREFSSEWVDPIQYRIGMLDYAQRVQGVAHE
jgi:hypothetical protein